MVVAVVGCYLPYDPATREAVLLVCDSGTRGHYVANADYLCNLDLFLVH